MNIFGDLNYGRHLKPLIRVSGLCLWNLLSSMLRLFTLGVAASRRFVLAGRLLVDTHKRDHATLSALRTAAAMSLQTV